MNTVDGKISICALAYNHVNYVDDFFNGVLNQQVPGYKTEVIIGIDKCDDGTLQKCVEYKNKFPDLIKLIIHSERVGMMQNFVTVLRSADGEYIAFCECDDYWIDDYKLSSQINTLEHNENAGICFTDIKISKSGSSFFIENWATIIKEKYSLADIIKTNVITTCSVVMKNNLDSSIINLLMKFEVGDWPLYILSMMKDNTKAVYLNKVTSVYRQHEGGTHSTKNTVQRLITTTSVYKSMLDIEKLNPNRKLFEKALAKNYYSLGIFQNDKIKKRQNYILSMKSGSYYNLKFPFFSALRFLTSFISIV